MADPELEELFRFYNEISKTPVEERNISMFQRRNRLQAATQSQEFQEAPPAQTTVAYSQSSHKNFTSFGRSQRRIVNKSPEPLCSQEEIQPTKEVIDPFGKCPDFKLSKKVQEMFRRNLDELKEEELDELGKEFALKRKDRKQLVWHLKQIKQYMDCSTVPQQFARLFKKIAP